MGERLFRFLWSKAIYFKNSDEINEFREIMMDSVREYKLSMKLLYPIVGKAVVVYYDANCRKIDSKYLIEWEYSAVPWNEAKKQCNLKNDKEEKDMLKILEIYKEKQTKVIEQKYDSKLKELEENDPIAIWIEQSNNDLRQLFNDDTVYIEIHKNSYPADNLTEETLKEKKEIIETIRKEKRKLCDTIAEIEALMDLAPNYEEKMKILMNYDIVDKKGKLK